MSKKIRTDNEYVVTFECLEDNIKSLRHAVFCVINQAKICNIKNHPLHLLDKEVLALSLRMKYGVSMKELDRISDEKLKLMKKLKVIKNETIAHENKVYEKAKLIAEKAHAGQKDKVGADYILHPLAVAELCQSTCAKTVALLHDIVENTDITLDFLRAQEISEAVIQAVDCLTKRKGENLDSYLNRVATNEIAIEVKFCDMLHNADFWRFPNSFDWQESEKIKNRYRERMTLLKDKIGEKTYLLSSKVRNEIERQRIKDISCDSVTNYEDIEFLIHELSYDRTYIFMFNNIYGILGYYSIFIFDAEPGVGVYRRNYDEMTRESIKVNGFDFKTAIEAIIDDLAKERIKSNSFLEELKKNKHLYERFKKGGF